MTLDHWLAAATVGLPPEVAQRVRAEYAAHVQDSGQPEAEAVAALGEPERVRRALHRTYLGEERLRTLRGAPRTQYISGRLWPWLVWGIPPLYALFIAWIYTDEVPFPWWRLAAPALTLLLMALLWRLTRPLSAERKTLWRSAGGGLSIQFMLLAQWVLQAWHGETFIWPWFLPVFGLALLGLLFWTAWEDQRLRRPLALREGRP